MEVNSGNENYTLAWTPIHAPKCSPINIQPKLEHKKDMKNAFHITISFTGITHLLLCPPEGWGPPQQRRIACTFSSHAHPGPYIARLVNYRMRTSVYLLNITHSSVGEVIPVNLFIEHADSTQVNSIQYFFRIQYDC